MSLSPLSLSHSHTLSMNTNAVNGPTSHPPIFFAGMGGRGETEQFQLSILPHEVGSAWLAATPMPFFPPAEQYWWYCALPLQQCLTCVSGVWFLTRVERKKDVCACCFFSFSITPSFFLSSGWEVFFGRRERRKQKAAGEGEQLATANPPFHTQTGDNGGHWSICFYLSFFVLFFPHRAAGRCFAFPFARSLGPLSSYLFRHLPGQQFLLFMSETRREREAEGQRKRGRGFFFFGPFYPLFFPPPPLHSFFPAFLSIRITSSLSIPVQPTLSPSSTSPLFPPPPNPTTPVTVHP